MAARSLREARVDAGRMVLATRSALAADGALLTVDEHAAIAALLVEKGPRVTLTHQAIADHLGVAREMVSRVMRGFSEHGWIAQSREAIQVLDVAALDLLSRGNAG